MAIIQIYFAVKILPIIFRKDGFYTQPFAFGGEEGKDKFDHNIRYRGSLQNYLIETGKDNFSTAN